MTTLFAAEMEARLEAALKAKTRAECNEIIASVLETIRSKPVLTRKKEPATLSA